MKKLEKYNSTKTYMFPNGALGTPAVVSAQYPATSVFAHVVETDDSGEVMFALQNLSAMRSMHGVDSTLTEAEAIAAIETIINTVPESEPSADERIAAALEYQNLLTM